MQSIVEMASGYALSPQIIKGEDIPAADDTAEEIAGKMFQ